MQCAASGPHRPHRNSERERSVPSALGSERTPLKLTTMSEATRRRAWRVALLVSLAAHALGFFTVRGLLRLPKLELDLALPSEVEFGVVEEEPKPVQTAAPAQKSPEATSQPEPEAPQPTAVKRPKPKPRHEPPLPPALAEAGDVARYAPKGTLLALRLDLDRIRRSPLSDEAGALLGAIPDVRALLDGSGVDPLRDLSRLFLASPDLRREHVVMAGRYVGDEGVPRAAVERLAQRSGQAADWRQSHGIPTAPWHNADATARVLALVGPSVFAITRPDDLPRVLAVARAARRRERSDGDAADALVSMADRELLNLGIENARSFVRGARTQIAPEQLSLSIREDAAASDRLELRATGRYPDEKQAETALQYWESLRDRYASHALIALMNLSDLLRDLQLTRAGAELNAHVVIPPRQARLLMRFARDSIRGPEPPAPAAPAP